MMRPGAGSWFGRPSKRRAGAIRKFYGWREGRPASAHRLGCGFDIAPFQQIVQAADPIPAITVGLDHQVMFSGRIGLAVILRSRLTRSCPALSCNPDRERDLARLGVEIVNEQHRIVPPVVAHRQNGRIARRHDSKSPQPISGTSLRILMMRSVQFSIESGSRRCSAALTCS